MFFFLGLHTIPHDTKVELRFWTFYKFIKKKKSWNVLSQVFNRYVMENLNKFRSKHLRDKSHVLTLGAVKVFFYDYLISVPLYQLSVRSLSRVVHFKHRYNHKDQGGFLLVDG
jgi:hypothetical protein